MFHSASGMENGSVGLGAGDDKQHGIRDQFERCLQCKNELIRNCEYHTCSGCLIRMGFCNHGCYIRWMRDWNKCIGCNTSFFDIVDIPYSQLRAQDSQLRAQVKYDAFIISSLCTLYAAKNIPTILGSIKHWRFIDNCMGNVFAGAIGITTLCFPTFLIEKKPEHIGGYEDKPFLQRLFSMRSLLNMALMSYISAGFAKQFIVTDIAPIVLKSLAISAGIEIIGNVVDPYIAKKFPQTDSYDVHGLLRFVTVAGVSQLPYDKVIGLLSRK